MTSWKGCRCCWGSRSCCLIRHGVFIITSCARVLLASSSSSFFFVLCVHWPSKGGQQHKRAECVCICKDGHKRNEEEKKDLLLLLLHHQQLKGKPKKRERFEGIYDPPPFCLHYLTSKKKKRRNRDFDLDFFDQLTSIEEFILLTGGFLSGLL